MVSVQRVYNTLKNLANKDQKGFITPSVFNSFAHIAQLNVFNEIMGELVEARKMNRAGVDAGSVLSMRDRKIEDMSYYLKKAVFSANSERKKPSDLYKISYITSEGSSDFQLENYDTPYGRCEIIYNPRLFEQLKISRLSGFSDDYRIALIGREKIEVWPSDNYSDLFMYYYCVPGSFSYNTNNSNNPYTSQNLPPSYAVNMLDGVEIFDVFNSRNFHLPPSYESELVSEMASMIGLNLRDTEIQAYSQENTVAE